MPRRFDVPRWRNARPTLPTGRTRRRALRPVLAVVLIVLIVAAGGCVNVRLNPSLGKGSPARQRAILAAGSRR